MRRVERDAGVRPGPASAEVHGVPILPIASHARRDAAVKEENQRVFDANFGVYGVCKIWRQMKREGFDIVRCTVASR